jgi:hypothetical protein
MVKVLLENEFGLLTAKCFINRAEFHKRSFINLREATVDPIDLKIGFLRFKIGIRLVVFPVGFEGLGEKSLKIEDVDFTTLARIKEFKETFKI